MLYLLKLKVANDYKCNNIYSIKTFNSNNINNILYIILKKPFIYILISSFLNYQYNTEFYS